MLAKVRTEMSKLDYVFKKAPILIGGGAMEYYGMRETDHDFDFIISMDMVDLNKKRSERSHYFLGNTR